MQRATRQVIFGTLYWLMGAEALAAAGASDIALQRDPFRRPAATAAKAPAADTAEQQSVTPRLRAIIYNSTKPLANIDGNFLEVGGTVYDYRLVLVKEQEVILEKDGNRFALTLDKVERQ